MNYKPPPISNRDKLHSSTSFTAVQGIIITSNVQLHPYCHIPAIPQRYNLHFSSTSTIASIALLPAYFLTA